MARLWGWKVPKRGLGVLLTDAGLALAQSQTSAGAGEQQCAWHWHLWSQAQTHEMLMDWPDPAHLRRALVRSGFQANSAAFAVPEEQLQRFKLTFESGMNTRQIQMDLGAQLGGLLKMPLHETVWDFQIQAHPEAAINLNSSQPAWLQAAMQTQSTQSADVLVITREWVHACEQWCRAAGLKLVRLEPPWQASERWHVFLQTHAGRVNDTVAQALTSQQQAILGGLALGVVMP